MLFYKIKKIVREKGYELLLSSSMIAFIGSFLSLFPIIFIYHDEFSRSEKKQMFFVSTILVIVNLSIIYFIDSFFGFNIIFSILIGGLSSFLVYLIPSFILILSLEINDLVLDKDEIRDVKLNSLLRKLF